MISWQRILKEEIYSPDFELIDDNDKYIIDGVKSSYNAKLVDDETLKEILDGAYQAGFKLGKRRYSSKTVYVLYKSYKNAYCVFQFSVKPETIMVCEVAYGNDSITALNPKAKKSKYFTTLYNKFDKTLPLEFLNTDIDKSELQEQVFIEINNEYKWDDYFDYVYSFMMFMLDKLNLDSEVFLEESKNEIEEEEKFKDFKESILSINDNIKIEQSDNKISKDIIINISWKNDYDSQSKEHELLCSIINQFVDSLKQKEYSVEIEKYRSNKIFNRSLFIKY